MTELENPMRVILPERMLAPEPIRDAAIGLIRALLEPDYKGLKMTDGIKLAIEHSARRIAGDLQFVVGCYRLPEIRVTFDPATQSANLGWVL